MIPIQLTIQGLYSYQKKQTIDFTTLTAAGLFGIFGSVGSGKSSVLEAFDVLARSFLPVVMSSPQPIVCLMN